MKKLLLIPLLLSSQLSLAGGKLDLDVSVGVEAYLIGQLDMAKALLENALEEFNSRNDRSEFSRPNTLSEVSEQAAIEHLFPIYFELRMFEQLKGHVKRYGVKGKSSNIAHYKNVRDGQLWTCRTLDFNKQFIKASECWDSAGYEEERNISIRAGAVKRIFSNPQILR